MYDKFYAYIRKHNMLCGNGGIVIAVSGGADSTCLFHLCAELGRRLEIPVYCAHVNHLIRPTAARDSGFVRKMCEENGIEFFLKEVDIPKLAKGRKISEELCGREERYKFFFDVMNKTNSRAVFTAHNLNDSAESLIFHLVRGSGSGGLAGIAPKRRDGVCRPLLCFTRAEIEEYLCHNKIAWVEDETNETDEYTRNYIRHNIFPKLEEINPSVFDCIVRTGALLSADNALLCSMADDLGAVWEEKGAVVLDCKKLKEAPPPVAGRAVVKALKMAEIEPSFTQVGAVMELAGKQTGKKHIFPCGKTARAAYGRIRIAFEDSVADYEYDLAYNSEIFIKETGKRIGVYTSEPKEGKYIRLSGIDGNLKARKRRVGDKFIPNGMDGFKKVKNFFIDSKIGACERERTPIITCGADIVCVGMYRADKRYTGADGAVYLQIH